MPLWESELETLLKSLGVAYSESLDTPAAEFVEESRVLHGTPEESDAEFEHLTIIQDEIEATMSEVTRLMCEGNLEPTLCDDIAHVLHTLMRPASTSIVTPDEWQLESSAAVLHFCRLVMRLTRNLD